MELNFIFFFNSALLGIGLAMDAFSVSLANGLNEPCMKHRKALGIAAVFAFFQALMPLIGWCCIHTIAQHFKAFEKLIPWIALILLCFIGGKMLYEGIKCNDGCCECCCKSLGLGALLIQGVATSIDALSVGFTIADYDLFSALVAAGIISAVTFAICTAGIFIGRKVGTALSDKAGIFGGAILIIIGLEIFITSWF
ncbi:MAG: manganese efflux pump [Ruminococcaceae bacterium]|nr:manganese efflux pump [Oscillospiraceae bacterium]